VDKRLGFELKHVPRRECEREVEKDGVGSCTSEIMHPVWSAPRFASRILVSKLEFAQTEVDLHLGSTSIHPLFPNQVIPIPVDDRVSSVRGIKHLSRVEDE
jgi:hypothetical protein